MRWNEHFALKGQHAILSASKYSWLNYDKEKFERMLIAAEAAALGTRKHAFASEAIELGQKLPDNTKTLNRYVNDAIGYRMTPEKMLYVSEYCFGTPDAIGFTGARNDRPPTLRISDLKTGEIPGNVKQLLIYAAMFFLEYGKDLDIRPAEVKIELRIYQFDDVALYIADPNDVVQIISTINEAERIFRERKAALL